ncbi:MAG: acyl-CoA synthetase [Marmoricola sp.]|nr:acyl-CoA synthetase [Marmoricola sp.]
MATSGTVVTHTELDDRANQLAHLLRAEGLVRGDTIAILMENNEHYHVAMWAARRSGLYFTTINAHLGAGEIAYILNDSGAALLVSSEAMSATLAALDLEELLALRVRLIHGEPPTPAWASFADAVSAMPTVPIADESAGDLLQYSSGTTGQPKGIKRPLRDGPDSADNDPTVPFLRAIGFPDGGTYLSPAPIYHTAPAYWTMAVQRLGGTVVMMEKYDAEHALALISAYQVTHAQFVPSHFVRMLKLDDEVRAAYDVSSLRQVVHAAAPCPVPIKQQMIAWWGPVISEFYSSSEGAGATFISAADWLEHPGSVGKPMLGVPSIVGPDGGELPNGEIGDIYFAGGASFAYLNDPDKTASVSDSAGRVCVGDIGYLDDDGFLYLTDRKSFMVISGGVNIYPQEAENVLVSHHKVMDAAVFGVPDPDLGERVHAVIEPVHWADAGPDLAAELTAYCAQHLARYKVPRGIDFDPALPRLDNGKLYKQQLRERYTP